MARLPFRWIRIGVIAVAIVLTAGFAVGSLTKHNDRAAKLSTGPISGGALGAAFTEPSSTEVAARSVSGGGSAGTVTHDASLGTLDLPAAVSNVIKTADIGLEVRRRGVDRALDRVVAIAAMHGGYVLSSGQGGPVPLPAEGDKPGSIFPAPASGGDDGTADIVIRVPADRFERAVADLTRGELGKVTRRSFFAQDVSQEVVDLESRARNLRAQEAVLLRLMSKANTIGDSIAVQQQLSQVQGQIEEITGRQRYLKSQTAFATIAVHLAEPGAAAAGDGPSFTKAWDTAVAGLERMGTAALIGATWLMPFIVIGLGLLAARRWRAGPAPQA